MLTVKFRKELESIKEGIPYTWGTGIHYYVQLGGIAHAIGPYGIQPEPHVDHKIRTLDGFRYATHLEIKDS